MRMKRLNLPHRGDPHDDSCSAVIEGRARIAANRIKLVFESPLVDELVLPDRLGTFQ